MVVGTVEGGASYPTKRESKGVAMDMTGWDQFRASASAQGRDLVEQQFAEQLVEVARENGMATVDAIEIDLTVEGDPHNELGISESSIRQKANALLGA